jgi:hypothetical protein
MKISQRSPGGAYKQSSGDPPSLGKEGLPKRGATTGDAGQPSLRRKQSRDYGAGMLETPSRKPGVTSAMLSGWRDRFLDGGLASLNASEPMSSMEGPSD